MKLKLIAASLFLFVIGCSSNIVRDVNYPAVSEVNKDTAAVKKFAQDKFINGSILETKGQFADAIVEYLAALKYDPQPGIYYSIAKNYYRLNKLSSALNYSQKAVEKEPDNTEYLMLEASIYSASHSEDSALVAYQKVIDLDSTNVNAYFGLAQISESKKPSAALVLYKKIIEMIGPEWSVLVRIADLNERMGNIKETIFTVEELLKLNPSDLNLQKLLIESYIKTKEFNKALERINESMVSYPDDETLIDLKGKVFVSKGMWKDASETYMKIIKNPKVRYEYKLQIGTSFLGESEKDSVNLDLAKQIFLEMKRDTSDWQVNAYLGEIELRKRNDESAIEYFKTAVKLAEWNSQVWTRLGGLLFDNRKFTEAIDFMKTASEKFPNDFAINLIYGLSLSAENKHLEAKDALEKALRINPNDINALTAMGYTLNQLKKDSLALGYLNKALIYDPNNLQAISILALIHESKKEFQISDSLYASALKIDSTNALLLNNFAYSLAERQIRLNEALIMAKKAVEKESQNSSYLDTIGWIYYRLDDYNRAKKNIEEAIKLENNNATLIEHLGDVYYKMGERKKAIEQWKKAFEIDSTKTELKLKIEKGEL